MTYRRHQDPVRLLSHLSVPTREGARLADEIYERSKDTLGRIFRGDIEMTDKRYDGPDGEKRLELLEELAKIVSTWIRRGTPPLIVKIVVASDAIDDDNERVSRLKNKT